MKKKVSPTEEYNKILEDIGMVRIQGAENIAKAGIRAFLIKPTKSSAKKVLGIRPTEPLLQNALTKLLKAEDKVGIAENFLWKLEQAHEDISFYGSKLIENDMNIYSHCHSSTVIDILKYAKSKGKNFVIYTTEVEPLLQGRKTAKELAKMGIKVIVGPDLASEQLMEKCDLFLFGIDAITPKYMVNKLGTATLCEIARKKDIPRYACGVSKKFASKVKIEKRDGDEVWRDNVRNIEIENPAFDKVPKELLTGIISEFGILTYEKFLKEVKL